MRTIAVFALLAPTFVFAQSISNLPGLSRVLVHHYDCRLAHLPSNGEAKETYFQVSPQVSGHSQTDFTLTHGADNVSASANAQMMSVVWSRNGKTVASSQAWVQNSTTQAFVLMVADPADEGNQVHMNCNAVTFDQVKK